MSICSSCSFRPSVRPLVVNKSSPMDRHSHTFLLIFYCSALFCICGKVQGFFHSCDVKLKVKRGFTYEAAPEAHLAVACPVQHCGQPLNISWCKLLNTTRCVQINSTDNVETHQSHGQEYLISHLTFRRVSFYDDGLYRCYIEGHKNAWISHVINISVSDSHQGVEKYEKDYMADQSPGGRGVSWLPYFLICAGMALLVTSMTAMTHGIFNCKKRTQTTSHASEREMPTHVLPDLPKGSAPSSPCLQTPPRLPSHPPQTIKRNPPAVASAAAESQKSDHAAYATIKHKTPETPEGQKQTTDAQSKTEKYALINMS